MKKLLTVLLVLLLLIPTVIQAGSLPVPQIPDIPRLPIDPKIPDIPRLPIDPDKIPDIPGTTSVPLPDIPRLPIDPKIPDIPRLPIDPKIPDIPRLPIDPKIPDIPRPLPPFPKDPKPVPTPNPKKLPRSGRIVTSEGPLFLMFRGDLTEKYEMFTPLDLSVDGDFFFPLVSSDMRVVGEVKVTVAAGVVTVKPYVVSGVTLKKGIMTFFPDIASVTTIKPSRLKSVNLPFNVPVHVESRFGTDPRVLLYINCPVTFKANTPGLFPFSIEDPDYLQRVANLMDLMD